MVRVLVVIRTTPKTSAITTLNNIDGGGAVTVPAQNWQAVTYGADKFVAVATSGSNANAVMHSADGLTWTSANAASAGPTYKAVTYGGGKFCAVAAGQNAGSVMYSSDGISWTATTPPAEGNGWYSVAYGTDRFVAVGAGGTRRVMYSMDAINWTSGWAAPQQGWTGVAYGNGRFVAVCSSSSQNIMHQGETNVAQTWTMVNTSVNLNSVAYGDGKFVAVGLNAVMYSTDDAATWTEVTPPGDGNWNSIAYGNGMWVATAISRDNRVMYSPDAINWTVAEVRSNQWYSVTYGGDKFVAVSGGGTTCDVFLYWNNLDKKPYRTNFHQR